ncbi:MAG TPA: hypothetical protein PK760_09855, partial [Flavobacteriales bacterium]|nr:hypothetical protein [Flavobacteriales bacterium]
MVRTTLEPAAVDGIGYLGGMFEHKSHPVISNRRFAGRLLRYLGYTLLMVALSLAIGVGGYMYFAHLRFADAFLNASMILGGMGPVDPLPSDSAKYFASFYALYSGITLLGTVAVFLAPVLHRILHILHLERKE